MSTEKFTFTYKKVPDNHGGEIPVELDVHLPTQQAAESKPLKIVLWFHGGGLVQGSRSTVPDHFLQSPNKFQLAFISADYRLAPQVRLPSIQDDIADCLSYIIHSLPSELSNKANQYTLDTSSIALSGGSAGGYLAFLLGLGMTKCPPQDLKNLKAISPIYPITDFSSDFFTKPSEPFQMGQIGGYNQDADAEEKFKDFVNPKSKVVTESKDTPYRNLLYFWAQEKALFPTLVYDEGSIEDGLIQKTSISRFIKENKGKKSDWKPCFIIHGDKDKAVAVQQARDVVQSFKEVGFENFVYEEREGTDHLFDMKEDPMENMWKFISEHLELK